MICKVVWPDAASGFPFARRMIKSEGRVVAAETGCMSRMISCSTPLPPLPPPPPTPPRIYSPHALHLRFRSSRLIIAVVGRRHVLTREAERLTDRRDALILLRHVGARRRFKILRKVP